MSKTRFLIKMLHLTFLCILSAIFLASVASAYFYLRGSYICDQIRNKSLHPSNFRLFYVPQCQPDGLGDAIRQTFPRGTSRFHVQEVMLNYSGALRQGESTLNSDIFRYKNPLIGSYFGTAVIVVDYDEHGDVQMVSTGSHDFFPEERFDPEKQAFDLSQFSFSNYEGSYLKTYVLRKLLYNSLPRSSAEKLLIISAKCEVETTVPLQAGEMVRYRCAEGRSRFRKLGNPLTNWVDVFYSEDDLVSGFDYKGARLTETLPNPPVYIDFNRKAHNEH